MDASIHDWFSDGAKWALYTAIDDTTSIILACIIAKAETTEGCFKLFKQLAVSYGIPAAFYADRHTTFVFNGDKEVSKRARIQFEQARHRLGVNIINTSNAVAKGRVERSFRTMQSRLVSELRVLGIKDPLAAEQYLLRRFMPAHNKRHSKPLRSPVSAFRNLTPSEIHNLDVILASRYARTILNGNIISYKNTQYMPIDSYGQIVLIPGGTTVVITDNGI